MLWKRILDRLFPEVCKHSWVEEEKIHYKEMFKKGFVVTQRCLHCGELVSKKIITEKTFD